MIKDSVQHSPFAGAPRSAEWAGSPLGACAAPAAAARAGAAVPRGNGRSFAAYPPR